MGCSPYNNFSGRHKSPHATSEINPPHRHYLKQARWWPLCFRVDGQLLSPNNSNCLLLCTCVAYFGFPSFVFSSLRCSAARQSRPKLERPCRSACRLMTNYFHSSPPGEEDVSIGDMRFNVEKLTAWRNHLDDRLNNRPILHPAGNASRSRNHKPCD